MTTSQSRLAVIGGTGLVAVFDDTVASHAIDSPYGAPSAPIALGRVGDHTVAFLPRHGNPHRIPPHCINYRANLWALRQLGVEQVIAVNAVGGICRDCSAGSLLVPDQIIDYTYGREQTFADSADVPLLHVDFSSPFDTALRDTLLATAAVEGIAVIDGGVYGVTQGPRLETAAEIERMARDGCDVVGMTAMPEAVLARELGLAYATLCLVVNPAAGRGAEPITLEAIAAVTAAGMGKVRALLAATIATL